MTRQELELLKELAQKLAEKRKSLERKETFQKVLKVLDKVPEIRGRIVQPTANDFFGRSWEKGIKVSYRNKDTDKWRCIKHNADVSYEDVFPHTSWKETTDESIAEQLFNLFTKEIIDYDTEIKFEFLDWEYKTYNRNKIIVVPFKKILPEVLRIVEKNLPKEIIDENEILKENEILSYEIDKNNLIETDKWTSRQKESLKTKFCQKK
ncbi:MAG: hypothetical protein QXP34_00930 [Candidatus Aenigmatarchaeota archaeon]